ATSRVVNHFIVLFGPARLQDRRGSVPGWRLRGARSPGKSRASAGSALATAGRLLGRGGLLLRGSRRALGGLAGCGLLLPFRLGDARPQRRHEIDDLALRGFLGGFGDVLAGDLAIDQREDTLPHLVPIFFWLEG